MNTKDLEVIAKMKQLIYKASVELASEYERERYPYGEHEDLSKYQIITSCLDYGYGKIWDEYWEYLKND